MKNGVLSGQFATSSTRTSRGRKFPLYKKKHKPIRTRWPIEKNNHPTEFLPFPRLLRAAFFFGQAQQGHRHVLRHSDATKPMRSPQRRTHCKETAFFAVRMRHDGNTRPAAARKLQRDDSLGHSDATKAMRSPQRHTHCRATKSLHPWLPHVQCNESLTRFAILVKNVTCHTVSCHAASKNT